MIILFRLNDYKLMPWKNGRGETLEISRFPKEDPYLWRLSMAPVVENGPFSLFPGFDRYITLVEGKGLKLNNQLVRPGEVFKFSGDENISGDLIDGKIIDLNLIIKRDQVKAKFEILKSLTNVFAFIPKGKMVLIFCLRGQLVISNENFEYILDTKNTIQMENPSVGSILIKEKAPNSLCVLIELDY